MDYMTDSDSYFSYHLKMGMGKKGQRVSVIIGFYWGGKFSPQPNPQPGGPEDHTLTLE